MSESVVLRYIMKPTIDRAKRFEESNYKSQWWRLSRRFYRRVERRIARWLHVEKKFIRYDPYDNSIEVYGCDHARRLTGPEADRIFGTGISTCWLNSDRQQVTYSLHRGNGHEPKVDVTTRNEWRKCYPDTIVLGPGGKHMTLAEHEAGKAAENERV